MFPSKPELLARVLVTCPRVVNGQVHAGEEIFRNDQTRLHDRQDCSGAIRSPLLEESRVARGIGRRVLQAEHQSLKPEMPARACKTVLRTHPSSVLNTDKRSSDANR